MVFTAGMGAPILLVLLLRCMLVEPNRCCQWWWRFLLFSSQPTPNLPQRIPHTSMAVRICSCALPAPTPRRLPRIRRQKGRHAKVYRICNQLRPVLSSNPPTSRRQQPLPFIPARTRTHTEIMDRSNGRRCEKARRRLKGVGMTTDASKLGCGLYGLFGEVGGLLWGRRFHAV